MVLIAAAVGIISMFLPWWSISLGFLGGGSVSGMHGAGILVFFCFVAAGVLAFMGDQTANLNQTAWMMVLIAGSIAALITVINFFDPPPIGNSGIGLYGALIAAVGVIAFAFMYRSAGQSLQSGFDSLKGDVERRMHSTTTPATPSNAAGTATTVSTPPPDEPTRPTA